MRAKTEKSVTAKPSLPKWSGPLSLPPEQLEKMASNFGLSYKDTSAKSLPGAGVLSLPTEQLARATARYRSVSPASFNIPATSVPYNASGSAGWSSIFSLPPEQLARVATRVRPGFPADAKPRSKFGAGGLYSLPLVDMHEMAVRFGHSRSDTSATLPGTPTVGKSAKSTPPVSFYTPDMYQFLVLNGPLAYGSVMNTTPVTATPTAPTKSSKSDAVAKEKKREILGHTPEELHQLAWEGLNFTAVAAATSASIVAVTSPLKTVIVSLSRTGAFVPPYTGGIYGLVKVLYAGTTASLGGSLVRSGYVTGAKKLKPVEGSMALEEGMVSEEGATGAKRLPDSAKGRHVITAAFGDILVTQIPESLSMLKKVPGLIPEHFKWHTPHNAIQLMAGGFAPRYMSGMINFASLCLLEESIANALPVENDKARHTLSGAASGATAAVIGYPLTALKDYTLVRAHVTPDGKLVNKSTFEALKEMVAMVRANPEQALRSFASNAVKQMPTRVLMTSAVFAIVAGVGESLGNEPLRDVVSKRLQPPATPPATASSGGFFSGSTPKAQDKVAPTKDKTPDDSPTSGPM